MRHDEYLRHDATALAERVRRGEIGGAELLDLAMAQLARVQPQVNALVRDLEPQARRQLAAGPSGVLAGVPFLLKDGLQDYAGVPTGYGSRSMQQVVPAVHAATTRRFLDAGLVVFGKTNLPEFGLKGVCDSALHGPVRNPWDLSRSAGGSSGGAAAAVAAGIVPMAAGSDGGGSIRIPAACCGLFGLKPSRGRISEAPAQGEVWFGACTHGVLSRSVRDTALALDILCGPEPGDPYAMAVPSEPFVRACLREPRRLRIGFSCTSPIASPVCADAVSAVERAATLLQGLGHHVEAAAPAVDGAALARSYLHLYLGQVPADIARAKALGARDADFEPLTRVMGVLGRARSAAQLTIELQRWNDFARGLADFHTRFDLLLTPTLAQPPLRHGATDLPPLLRRLLPGLLDTGVLTLLARAGALDGMVDGIATDNLTPYPFTQLANLTGVPAMSVPLHHGAEGLPMGVQFIARMGDEATLLQLATQLEQAAPWFDRLPPLARAAA